jgi:LysR family carnitine catabolism transcriptional activator
VAVLPSLAEPGIAALPTMAADVISGDGLVRRPLINPVIRRSIGLVKRREGSLSPAAEAMVSLLRYHQEIGVQRERAG